MENSEMRGAAFRSDRAFNRLHQVQSGKDCPRPAAAEILSVTCSQKVLPLTRSMAFPGEGNTGEYPFIQ